VNRIPVAGGQTYAELQLGVPNTALVSQSIAGSDNLCPESIPAQQMFT